MTNNTNKKKTQKLRSNSVTKSRFGPIKYLQSVSIKVANRSKSTNNNIINRKCDKE